MTLSINLLRSFFWQGFCQTSYPRGRRRRSFQDGEGWVKQNWDGAKKCSPRNPSQTVSDRQLVANPCRRLNTCIITIEHQHYLLRSNRGYQAEMFVAKVTSQNSNRIGVSLLPELHHFSRSFHHNKQLGTFLAIVIPEQITTRHEVQRIAYLSVVLLQPERVQPEPFTLTQHINSTKSNKVSLQNEWNNHSV